MQLAGSARSGRPLLPRLGHVHIPRGVRRRRRRRRGGLARRKLPVPRKQVARPRRHGWRPARRREDRESRLQSGRFGRVCLRRAPDSGHLSRRHLLLRRGGRGGGRKRGPQHQSGAAGSGGEAWKAAQLLEPHMHMLWRHLCSRFPLPCSGCSTPRQLPILQRAHLPAQCYAWDACGAGRLAEVAAEAIVVLLVASAAGLSMACFSWTAMDFPVSGMAMGALGCGAQAWGENQGPPKWCYGTTLGHSVCRSWAVFSGVLRPFSCTSLQTRSPHASLPADVPASEAP